MEISQYHRKQRLLGSAGNVIASPSDSWSELERMGNVLTQFGMASEQQRLKAEYYDQIASASLQADQLFEDHKNKLDPNSTDSWESDTDNLSYNEITAKITNSRAKADWGPLLEAKRFRQKKYISDYRRTVDTRNYQKNYYLEKQHSMEITAGQDPVNFDDKRDSYLETLFGLRLKEGASEVTFDNLESVEDYDNPMFPDLKLRKNEAIGWYKDTRELFEKEQLERQLNIALNMPDGLKYIDSLDISSEQKSELKNDYRIQKNINNRLAKLELETEQSKNHRETWAKIRNGELTDQQVIVDMVDNNELASTGIGDSLIKLMGKGPAENDDNKALFEAGKIKNRLRDGEITEDKAFEELVNLAPKLKDTTMGQMVKDLESAARVDDPLATAQSKRYLTVLQNLILGEDKSPSIEKLKFYNAASIALEDWIRKNPDATPDEISNFYESLTEPYIRDNIFFGWWGKQWEDLTKKLPKPSGGNEDLSRMSDDELRAIIESK